LNFTRLKHRESDVGSVPVRLLFDRSRSFKSVNKPMLGLIGPTTLFIGNTIDVIGRYDDDGDNDGLIVIGAAVKVDGDGVVGTSTGIVAAIGVIPNVSGVLGGALDGKIKGGGDAGANGGGIVIGTAVGTSTYVGCIDVRSNVGAMVGGSIAVPDAVGFVVPIPTLILLFSMAVVAF
jgi:hypothetical protein